MKNSFNIINAKIFTVSGEIIENGFISVENGRIKAVGEMPDFSPIEGEAYNLSGKCIFPGFIDVHCHIGVFDDGIAAEGDDGNEDTEPVTSNLRIIDAVNPFDRCFGEAVEAGVTTMLTSPGSSNPIAGQTAIYKSFSANGADNILLQNAGMKFALGENPKNNFESKNQSPVTRMATVGIIREQLTKAKRYLDDINRAKKDSDSEMPEYDAKCEALLPVIQGNKKAYFHAHRADDILTAIRISKEFSLDYVIVHCTDGHLISGILAEENARVIVGPVISDRGKPELANHTIENAAVLAKSNIPLAICTDHPELPIQYLPLSAAISIKGGLRPADALRAITLSAAEIAGIADRVGSIEAGKDADFVVFEKENDIFDITKKPVAVAVDGIIAKGSL